MEWDEFQKQINYSFLKMKMAKKEEMDEFDLEVSYEEMVFSIKRARVRDVIEAYEKTKGANHEINKEHLMQFINSDYFEYLVKKL